MAQNPDWPIVSWSAAFNADPNSTTARSWSDLTTGRLRGFNAKYGMQYELNQPETGEATVTVLNADEALNPANTSSPFNSAGKLLLPYRAILGTATWPSMPGNGNLLNATNLTTWGFSTDTATFEAGTIGSWNVFGSSPPTIINDTTRAHEGTRSLRVTWPTAANAGAFAVSSAFTNAPYGMRIGQQYTVSAWMWAAAGVPKMRLQCAGAFATSATFASAWQRVSVTFTATSTQNAILLIPDANTTAGQQVWLDSVMWEVGPTANAFAETGPVVYPLFAGYIERYPTSWEDNGYRGGSDMPAVDALAFLPRRTFKDVLSEDIEQDAPVLTAKCDEPAGSAYALPASWSKSTLQSQWVTLFNPTLKPAFGFASHPGVDEGTSLDLNPTDSLNFTFLYMPSTTPAGGGFSTSMEVWCRRSKTISSIEIVMAGIGADGHTWDVGMNASGQIFVRTTQVPATPTYAYTITDNGFSADNDWHHVVVTETLSGGTVTAKLYVDGTLSGTATRTAGGPFYIFAFNLGATGTPFLQLPFSGQVAWASMYASELPADRVASHYAAAKDGHAGDLTGVRLRRCLTWAGYRGGQSVPDGGSPMGPAVGLDGKKLSEVAQSIATTEQGYVVVTPDGDLTLVTRSQLLLQTTPAVTFGENTAGGEIPYEGDVRFDFDPQFVFNDIVVTGAEGISASAKDTASQASYFVSTLDVETDLGQQSYADALAAHLLNTYKDPHQRIESLTINPAARPALWPTALGLKFGDRVRVLRRTATFTMQADYYVVSREHNSSPGEWTTTFQLAPAGPTPWILGDATYGVLGTSTRITY